MTCNNQGCQCFCENHSPNEEGLGEIPVRNFLDITIDNIVRELHGVCDFAKFGLRYDCEHWRLSTDGKNFVRKIKGRPATTEDGEITDISSRQGFCEISVLLPDGHKIIGKANSPKGEQYNKANVRAKAIKKLKKTIILHLVEQARQS